MDKVKHYLRLAGKYHFWILCAVVALLTLGSWYSTRANLTKDFQDQKGKISGAESAVDNIKGMKDHPNLHHHTEMDAMITNYKQNLEKLWATQYIEQGKNMLWSEELSEPFRDEVKGLRPIETTVKWDPTNKSQALKVDGSPEIRADLKQEYQDFVKLHELPRLARIIGAVWEPEPPLLTGPAAGGGQPYTPPADGTPAEKVIVDWNIENQTYLQNSRFDWSREATRQPNMLQILYAQEDLWVMGTLINIIAKTNADADARHNAVVKEIRYMKLGADAVGRSGTVTPLAPPTAAAEGPYGQPGAPAPGGPTGPAPGGPIPGGPTPGGPTPTGLAALIKDPAEGRYVDNDYLPIPPERLRAAFTATDPKEAFLAVAKRMPVRMHLVVDQRYINRLLAECGNSNLIVEIRQIRINREEYAGSTTGGGANPYGPGGYGGREPNRGGFGGGGGAFGGQNPTGPRPTGPRPAGPRPAGPRPGSEYGRGGGTGTDDTEKSQHEVEIELYGLVYIYNPVNQAMVSAVANAAADPTAPAPVTTPATTPAPMNPVPAPAPMNPVPAPMNPAPAPMETTPMPMNTPPAATTPAEPMPMPMPMATPPAPM